MNKPSRAELRKAVAQQMIQENLSPSESKEFRAASFDTTTSQSQNLAELKKLQDPAKFGKARFSFRLYRQ